MRKAVIDLDWLDAEIEKLQNKGANSKTEEKLDFRQLKTLNQVRSKCEPIEELEEGKVFGVNDIRNKLSPIVNLIAMIENGLVKGNIEVHDLVLEEIVQVKKSIEYLTQLN